MSNGIFIVLEGVDGSGMATQFEALKNRLEAEGHEVEVFDFPRYAEPSSYFVSKYLNGEYGPASEVNPYTASLFFALDRYEASPLIRKALASGKVVLCNRFVGSNMAHQGAKFNDAIEKRSFFIWEDSIEFQLLNIPRPSLNLFLRVPAELSYELIGRKLARSYTDETHDQHEADLDHLKKASETYDLLCQLFPRDFEVIDCVEDGELLSVEAISQKVWNYLYPLLPTVEPKLAVEREVEIPLALETEPMPVPVPKPKAEAPLTEYRWRVPSLSYLAAIEIKSKLPELKISDASWAGVGSDYTFYTPPSLSAEMSKKYENNFLSIARLHRALHLQIYNLLIHKGRGQSLRQSDASKKATKILRAATPLSAHTSASLLIPKGQANEILRKLGQVQNEEVQKLGLELSERLSELWPEIKAEVEQTAEQQAMPEAISSIIEKLTQEMVPRKQNKDNGTLKLLDVHPRNEFDLIADSLSSYSSLPRNEILDQMDRWNYQQKIEALAAALHKSPDILERATYQVDYLGDWQAFIKMLKLRQAGDIQRQLASPGEGYTTPAFIEEELLDDAYAEIFAQSRGSYDLLQLEHDGRTLEYGLFLGHRLHWQIAFSAAGIDAALRDSELSSPAKRLKKLVGTVHPTVAAHIGGESNSKLPQPKTAGTRSRRRKHRSSKKS